MCQADEALSLPHRAYSPGVFVFFVVIKLDKQSNLRRANTIKGLKCELLGHIAMNLNFGFLISVLYLM